MGYSNAKGGDHAIVAAEALVRQERDHDDSQWLGLEQITGRLRLAVDRVMGEGGLWAPELAARALRQGEGDVLEAAQLLRAHRPTLPRIAYSAPVSTDELRVVRRISPAFRNPPGNQLLGRTLDYVGRLLDLMPDEPPAMPEAEPDDHGHGHDHDGEALRHPPRLPGLLRGMGVIAEREKNDADPFDITRTPARPGAPRSARLSAMARAETSALVNLWYTITFQPDKHFHEIPGEVRHGRLPVKVTHPLTGNPVKVAEVRVTEVETIDDLDRPGEDKTKFDLGYGLCFGHNERKAIAMAGLDLLVHRGQPGLEQRVLMTLDGVEASGFLEHLKLPHYVDFRATLDRKRAVKELAT